MTAFPKGPTRKTLHARKKRAEAAVIKQVRAACVERDGYCALAHLGGCGGPSEWAHRHSHRRSKTRGLPPLERHEIDGSLMLCQRHHRAYDAHQLEIAS